MQPARRRFLQALAASYAGFGMSGWLPALAADADIGEQARQQNRHCVLLWMTGGPAQTDTFDMKPGHSNGGPFKEIATAAAGLRICEHLPQLASHGNQLAVLRGLSTREGDHGRGTYLMHTGRTPDPVLRYPTVGSLLAKELGRNDVALPNFVSVNPYLGFEAQAYESGFLGPRYASLNVKPREDAAAGFAQLGVDYLQPPTQVSPRSTAARLDFLSSLQQGTAAHRSDGPLAAHRSILARAIQLMQSDAGKVFDLSTEPAEVRARYGPGTFGQGCLLARRLIEQGVAFVEVNLGDFGRWDTHNDNFTTVQQLCSELDAGWSALMTDLSDRGLLESTTILWMGEFGRTPQINGSAGRDHFPDAWTAVLAGGGIRGGQAYGRTSADGMAVEDGMIGVQDLLATLCRALRIDPVRQNVSDIGRPFKIADGKPIQEVLL